MPKCLWVGKNDREEWRLSLPFPCCPVNHSKEKEDKKKLNCFEIFAP